MTYLAWILVGAFAGFLATDITRSRGSVAFMVSLGMAGALLTGLVSTTVLNLGGVDGVNVESLLIATLGAFAFLAIANSAYRSMVDSVHPQRRYRNAWR
jgi:uncharacterized membrane protein YeaQ/YmgE (transglycosylase-associated protein family)